MPSIAAAAATSTVTDESSVVTEAAEGSIYTTASIASFLNDSWTPSSYVAPIVSQAVAVQKQFTRNNTTLNNSTNAIYEFLDDNYTSPAAESPVYTAAAADKNGVLAQAGESIYDFANDKWTPGAEVEAYEQTSFKLHQMN